MNASDDLTRKTSLERWMRGRVSSVEALGARNAVVEVGSAVVTLRLYMGLDLSVGEVADVDVVWFG